MIVLIVTLYDEESKASVDDRAANSRACLAQIMRVNAGLHSESKDSD